MYLPRNLPLCRPHIAMWVGESGKRYEFAVVRPGTIAIDEPAVFILTKQEGARTTPLYVGQTSSLHRKFGLSSKRCPDEWRRALAMGMTHVHLRFDACSDEVRRAEALDLTAALMPVIELTSASEEGANDTVFRESAIRTAAVRVHERQGRGLVPEESGAQVPDVAFASMAEGASTNSYASASFFRADPAREDDGDAADVMPWAGSVPVAEQQQQAFDGKSNFATEEDEQNPIPLDLSSALLRHAVTDAAEECGRARAAESPRSDGTLGLGISGVIRRVLDFVARQWPVRQASTQLEPACTRLTSGMEKVAESPAQLHPPAESRSTYESTQDDETEESSANFEGQEVERQNAEREDAERQNVDIATPDIEGPDRSVLAVVPPEQPRAPEPAIDLPESAPPSVQQPLATDAGASPQEEARRTLNLSPAAPVVLFAGSMSQQAGADILMDAAITVCGGNDEAVFLFAGDGALDGELRARASRAGLDRRFRFLGHVPSGAFQTVLAACDFVAIPARVPLGEELARMALANGKPVLVTHQAAQGLVVHGSNGLVTYDNPGSFVWGIRELLGPLGAELRRHLSTPA